MIRELKLDEERKKMMTFGVEGLVSWVVGKIKELRVVLEFWDGDYGSLNLDSVEESSRSLRGTIAKVINIITKTFVMFGNLT